MLRPTLLTACREGPFTYTGLLSLATVVFLGGYAVSLKADEAPAGGKLPAAASKAIDFSTDIAPILAHACIKCHGPKKQEGGLRLDVRDKALAGGLAGKAITPRDSANSRLIKNVAGLDPDYIMPPEGPRLTDKEISLLRAWIDQGATWPDNAMLSKPGDDNGPIATDDARHWAFKPRQKPAVPSVQDLAWPQSPVDSFILQKLEAAKPSLKPSPPTDRATLYRRLHFDLLGLPPNPADIDAFVADNTPDAYARLVERLLASPQYGERWARHWLDVVRFAESQGFEMNQPRRNAWPFRDYVIRSFNHDLPFSRFITEHLAGDALDVHEATCYLVGGSWDQVKSPDIELTTQQRQDELHDMVSTTGSAFLGLTVGCARCHHHKFDPISQTDYYSLQAIFAGVIHGDREVATLVDPELKQRYEETRGKRDDLLAQASNFRPSQPVNPSATRRPAVTIERNTETFEPVVARVVRFTVLESLGGNEPCIDELEIETAEEPRRNVALGDLGAKATASSLLPNFAIHQVEFVNDGKYGNGRSWISNQRNGGWVQIELPRPEKISRITWGRDRDGKYRDRLALRYKIEIAAEPNQWKLVSSSDDRQPFSGQAAASDYPIPLESLAAADAERLKDIVARRKKLDEELKSLGERMKSSRIYAGNFQQPGPTHRLHRGEGLQKRELVAPGGIASLPGSPKLDLNLPEQQRRLALARWITDSTNPLTARVIANRIWQWHFGEGLVATPSDFGANGARPTHPELLDWLASYLVEHDWSIKELHRVILLSSTYQQSSAAREDGMQADAQSRLLWRYPPRRLESEPIRDSILSVSGKLDPRMGGPGFDVFMPNGNYVYVYTPRTELGPDTWRRDIYRWRPRMQLDATFGCFDCPDGGQIAPRRSVSTTPLQALNLFNGDFLLDQSKFFAERLAREAGSDPAAQVRLAFRLCFGRSPDDDELKDSAALIREHGPATFCRAMLNANEFLFVF